MVRGGCESPATDGRVEGGAHDVRTPPQDRPSHGAAPDLRVPAQRLLRGRGGADPYPDRRGRSAADPR
ncbi:protein of unknown function [Microbacterium sp. Nx66]|nr:protein of unknown function [Microbacterium sp. Nx66]